MSCSEARTSSVRRGVDGLNRMYGLRRKPVRVRASPVAENSTKFGFLYLFATLEVLTSSAHPVLTVQVVLFLYANNVSHNREG